MRPAAGGDTRKLYHMQKSGSYTPNNVGKVLLEQGGSVIPDQAITILQREEHFKKQHPRTPPFHQRVGQSPWMMSARPTDSCVTITPTERMAPQRRVTRRAIDLWIGGCIELLPKCEKQGFSVLSKKETSGRTLIIEVLAL